MVLPQHTNYPTRPPIMISPLLYSYLLANALSTYYYSIIFVFIIGIQLAHFLYLISCITKSHIFQIIFSHNLFLSNLVISCPFIFLPPIFIKPRLPYLVNRWIAPMVLSNTTFSCGTHTILLNPMSLLMLDSIHTHLTNPPKFIHINSFIATPNYRTLLILLNYISNE